MPTETTTTEQLQQHVITTYNTDDVSHPLLITMLKTAKFKNVG
jgi:hypothetical protein